MKKFNVKFLDFKKSGGILPAIIQDAETKAVLTLGYMNREALNQTIRSKKVTFWSRTKKRLWEKGETSGNSLEPISISADCDRDAILIPARPRGPACHTGAYSCFGVKKADDPGFLRELFDLIVSRKKELPESSYTASLFGCGLEKILEKVEEESGEVLCAARQESGKRLIEESADLLYHLFVLLAQKKITLVDVVRELERRGK